MDPISSIQNVYSYRSAGNVQSTAANSVPTKAQSYAALNKYVSMPSFSAAQAIPQTRTQLSKEETEKYSALTAIVDKKGKQQLQLLLANGILLNSNSNDKSTVLDNLYKTVTEPRVEGLDAKMILKETIDAVANPFVINQNFGNIPKAFQQEMVKRELQTKNSTNLVDAKTAATDVNVEHSSDCVAASIEFNLAKQMPAEYTRFAEQLTSPKLSVEKNIKLANLNENSADAKWLLDSFETPYNLDNNGNAKLTLAPDKNAILRAQIQNVDKDKNERSLVDVLMQSTFMNVGSQQTYDSLTDIRHGKFNADDKGLIEFEKTYTESVVEDKNKVSVTYQVVDENGANGKVVGYETDFNNMKKQILESLDSGENVIIGYVYTDKQNNILNGHEITIVGAKEDKKGNLIFICNDTDDDNPNPIEYSADYIIPKIHHAGLPEAVAKKNGLC